MTAFFITSTGTEIGKTLVTAALCHQLRAAGEKVRALKPIISGITDDDWAASDSGIIADALGLPFHISTLDALSPFRYKAPLAPSMAAALEGRTLDYGDLLKVCRAFLALDGTRLIEGVGGAFVPLTGRTLVADWIADLQLPSLMVTGSYLGTLSHSIATLEAMATRGLPVKAIVMSESAGGGHPDLYESAEALSKLVRLPVMALPRLKGDKPWAQAPDLTHLLA
ncbi:dethiobiotin synthase [Pseudokordiimonas caeni]|uniref:dethiobiotin synthase n=1 Tax=Pseudokordiimonas caeni TaxID=2997908 RepID=UPI0028126424|nr:dethiobiotin synthase [Pseudokordiimonas caeni]